MKLSRAYKDGKVSIFRINPKETSIRVLLQKRKKSFYFIFQGHIHRLSSAHQEEKSR